MRKVKLYRVHAIVRECGTTNDYVFDIGAYSKAEAIEHAKANWKRSNHLFHVTADEITSEQYKFDNRWTWVYLKDGDFVAVR